MFVPPARFCDRHPRSFCVESTRVTQIIRQTTVINNYNVNNHNLVNHGIPVDRISSGTHHSIEAVHVSSLPNAGRHGWHGDGSEHANQHSSANNAAGQNLSAGNGQIRHAGPELRNDANKARGRRAIKSKPCVRPRNRTRKARPTTA